MARKLTDKEAAAYFRRSYTAVDGLWFMKAEEMLGFEAALQLDWQVWQIMPKIQARFIKAALKGGDGLEAFSTCLEEKLSLEGFQFDINRYTTENEGVLEIKVTRCPWHDIMIKSGRGNLSEKISRLICTTENSVWALEFGDIRFDPKEGICKGSDSCVLRFEGKP